MDHYNILFAGNSGIGKTYFLNSLLGNNSKDEKIMYSILSKEHPTLNIYDTKGANIMLSYQEVKDLDFDLFVIMYDKNEIEYMKHLENWIYELNYLFGNKKCICFDKNDVKMKQYFVTTLLNMILEKEKYSNENYIIL